MIEPTETAVDAYWTKSACYTRRAKMCLAYSVTYDQETSIYTVSVFSIQNGRSPAPLGKLTMLFDEWKLFHHSVWRNWEDLEYPKENDKELI